eukprot:1781814-Lingulodinium_polyedra.AAC.1
MGREFSACAKAFRVLHQHGTPGIHRSSAAIERANREVIDRARTVLDQARLPTCVFGHTRCKM